MNREPTILQTMKWDLVILAGITAFNLFVLTPVYFFIPLKSVRDEILTLLLVTSIPFNLTFPLIWYFFSKEIFFLKFITRLFAIDSFYILLAFIYYFYLFTNPPAPLHLGGIFVYIMLWIWLFKVWILSPVLAILALIILCVIIAGVLTKTSLEEKKYHFNLLDRGRLFFKIGRKALRKLPPREELALIPGYGNGTYKEIAQLIKKTKDHAPKTRPTAWV